MKYIGKIFGICVILATMGLGPAVALDCDNDCYLDGRDCKHCPEPSASMWIGTCDIGFDEDGETCEPTETSIISGANSNCGYGNENDENELWTCRGYASIGDMKCRYCDATGCFILESDCYF